MDNVDFNAEEVLRLWQPIQKSAFRIVDSIVKDKYLTEDVLQDALIVASRKFHTLKDVDKFDKWFFTISARLAYKAIKKRSKVVPVEEIYYNEEIEKTSNQNMDESLLLIEDNDEFLDIIKTLPDRERHLINLRFVKEMKISEISEITGIKEGTLKSIYHRAFKKLKQEYLKEHSNGR